MRGIHDISFGNKWLVLWPSTCTVRPAPSGGQQEGGELEERDHCASWSYCPLVRPAG